MSKSRLLKRGYAAVLAIAIFLSVFLMQGAFFVYGEEGSESTNLSDFLTDVSIDAPLDENGHYIIRPDSSYDVSFLFSENEGVQFADTETLVYTFPEGMTVADIGLTDFSISISDENGDGTVSGNTYEIRNGQLMVRFNQEDPNFSRLTAMSNVRFGFGVSSRFDQTTGQIVFNPSIVKEFVFEESSDLTIDKNVVYDMETDTASYVLTITSYGTNENVVIEDHLTGTALTFQNDITVFSGTGETISVLPDYSSVENGFRVVIPSMSDGESVTLRYTAFVDNTKISSNGTVEQTNNTARVVSDQVPDGKEVSADFAGQATFHRISKTAAGDPVQLEENLYEQSWSILVNADHKLPMGNTYIYDWIVQNSRPFMQFFRDGITVNVTFENGETETRTVLWDDLFLYSDSHGTIGWRYQTPETDGNASYEIICSTVINTENALGDLTLVNGAQVNNSYDEGSVTIGVIGEDPLMIRKDAVGTTSEETEWQITVTVPGSGLSELHVVDDMPKLEYDGQTYIDYYVPDSMQIDGLLEGESWRLYIGSSERSFTVTFYQTEEQNNSNKGILPTPDGQSREIVIRFKTSVNQDWLNLAAEDGYESSQLRRHRNYACAWSNSYRTETVNASIIPIKPDFDKYFVERDVVDIDGVSYPVFRYSLALYGPIEDGAVIHDAF